MAATSERDLLRATTRRFIESEFPILRVREMAEDRSKFDREVWRRGCELGWTAMLVPEELGGGSISDQSLLDLVAVAEEMGRVIQPWPWLPANVVAFALAEAGPNEAQASALAAVAAGDAIATWALVDESGAWAPDDISMSVTARDDGYTLRGAKLYVQDADAADHLLVAARGDAGLMQLLVPADRPGVRVEPMHGLDFARRLFRVEFDNVAVPASSAVGASGDAREQLDRQLQLAFILQCAESVGGAERICELTFQYANDRFAFGRPIGSFQAVKHMCADMLVLLEGSKATTASAAAAFQRRDPDAAAQASIANAHVGAAFSKIARDAIQIHGGIGYTWEHDAHLYLRRAKANELLLGDAAWHRERLCQLAGV
jgi:alkylation response protein AidB-like acyl-CoA dehydrogenase